MEKQKTALQQLKNRLEDVFAGHENISYKLSDIKELVFKEIELGKISEKSHLEKFYKMGFVTGVTFERHGSQLNDFEEYYTNTYTDEKDTTRGAGN